MSFILPSDAGYRRAKAARQGHARLEPCFDGFVARFRERYGVAPLWLGLDRHAHGERRPRLLVVIERTADRARFLRASGGFDSRRQREVAEMLAEEVDAGRLRRMFGLPLGTSRRYDYAGKVFVAFTDFERVAEIEAHGAVTRAELDGFAEGLGLGERFWCTQRFAGPPVVFVHTEVQAAALADPAVREPWADAYFALVRPHDELGYLRREEIVIDVDSKEKFDEVYQGNWYYYFK